MTVNFYVAFNCPVAKKYFVYPIVMKDSLEKILVIVLKYHFFTFRGGDRPDYSRIQDEQATLKIDRDLGMTTGAQ